MCSIALIVCEALSFWSAICWSNLKHDSTITPRQVVVSSDSITVSLSLHVAPLCWFSKAVTFYFSHWFQPTDHLCRALLLHRIAWHSLLCQQADGTACHHRKGLILSHTRANWQAESSTSYELGWFTVNRQHFPVHSWQVEGPAEIVGVYSVGQWQTFLAEYPNCSCLQNKRVLLDTSIVHLSREQTLVLQGSPVWHHELVCRKSWRCVRLDYRSRWLML